MKKTVLLSAVLAVLAGCAVMDTPREVIPVPKEEAKPLETLQREFVELRYGMFIHFGILTYTGSWSQKNLDIKKFNPTELDCGQWADAAKAGGMTFGVLTTKHHDGFALWPTETDNFSVKNIPWRNGRGDVVLEYVKAFTERGLKPGLYYSVWDNTKGIGNGPITEEQIQYVEAQLKELLTNYGPIPVMVLDGYSWKMGHNELPYERLRAFIKSLQPNCLVLDHTHLQCLYNNDLAVFEEPKGVFAPEGNKIASMQDQKIIGGNDWFWGSNTETEQPMSLKDLVEGHLIPLEERYSVFILNCPPNRKGQLDDKIVKRLAEAGELWKPDMKRLPLPAQGPQNEYPVTIQSASATSGNAYDAIDAKNDAHFYSVWESEKKLPQSITLDLGETREDIGILCYVPKYVIHSTPTDQGAITQYEIHTSVDGEKFTKAAAGKWAADYHMKTVTFKPVKARFVRLTALTAKDGYAAATEVSVGIRKE